MINPYSLLRKIKACPKLYENNPGLKKVLLGPNAASMTATMLERLEKDPSPSVKRFYSDLKPLTRPGYDSLTYLNSAYSALEGMLKQLLNRIPATNLSSIPLWNSISKKLSVTGADAASYAGKTIPLNTNSQLALMLITSDYFDYLNRGNRSAEEVVKELYWRKFGERISDVQAMEFIGSEAGQLTVRVINTLNNRKLAGFALLLAMIKVNAIGPIGSLPLNDVQALFSIITDYRNRVAHGDFFGDEQSEELGQSRELLKNKRISHHNQAVAALLSLLILILGNCPKQGALKMFGYKIADKLSYTPKLLFYKTLRFCRNLAIGMGMLVWWFFLLAAFIGLFFAFTDTGIELKGFHDNQEKIAFIDAMIDSDINRLKELRNNHYDTENAENINRIRSKYPDPASTEWFLYKKSKPKDWRGKDALIIYSKNSDLYFLPAQSRLDNYAKGQLNALARFLKSQSPSRNYCIGVITPANNADLSRNPEIAQQRYQAIAEYLNALCPDVEVVHMDDKQNYLSAGFYFLFDRK